MIEAADTALVDALHPSPGFEPRRSGAPIDILLLHYTGMHSCERAIDWLSRPESRVSCHYVIDVDGRITQLVAERERAWHAGIAFWDGEIDINSRSVGFEIHNPGHDQGYPDFPVMQMQAVLALARDVIGRHAIPADRVLAHSDVAPHRKIDPGERFDWQSLAREGVGLWVDPVPASDADPGLASGTKDARVALLQKRLAEYGYGVSRDGVLDHATGEVVAAFQRHFRPRRVDGRIDRSTIETAERLLAARDLTRQAKA